MAVKLYAGLAALALILGLVWWGREGHQEAAREAAVGKVIATQRDTALEALRAAKEAAAAERILLTKRATVAEEQRTLAEAGKRKLDAALKSNPGWASAPVPDSVWDSIGPADPGPAPAPAAGQPDPGVPSARPTQRADKRRARRVAP